MKKSILILATFLFVISCSKKDEPLTEDCSTRVLSTATILSEKSTAFQTAGTTASCEEVRAAWLNSYNALKDCGYPTADLDATKASLYDIDCSVLNGGGGGPSTNGKISFFTPDNPGLNPITIICNGQTKTITSKLIGAPNCTNNGTIFSLPAGTYSYTASRLSQNWSGSVTVTGNGSCSFEVLVITTSGGGGATNGNVIFSTLYNLNGSTITVNCNGQTAYITSGNSSSNPPCGTATGANFSFPAGTYQFTASGISLTWSGSVTVNGNGSCKALILNVTGGGSGGGGTNIGHLTVWSPNTSVSTITVTCGGLTRNITSKYASMPNCEASGCAIFDLPYGNYTINANAAGGYSWNPFPITINNPDQCFIVGLQ